MKHEETYRKLLVESRLTCAPDGFLRSVMHEFRAVEEWPPYLSAEDGTDPSRRMQNGYARLTTSSLGVDLRGAHSALR